MFVTSEKRIEPMNLSPSDRVAMLIKLKNAVDIMRDVRPGDEASKEKIKVAMATIQQVMREMKIEAPH